MGLFTTLLKRKPKMYDNLDAATFEAGMNEDIDAVLLDVRTPGEYAEKHIPGSLNINLMDPRFMSKVNELDKNKTYYVYCRSGGRSASACGAMGRAGFERLHNLSGGIMGWHGATE